MMTEHDVYPDAHPQPYAPTRTDAPDGGRRFATLTFTRDIAAPPATVWHVWTAPAVRRIWRGDEGPRSAQAPDGHGKMSWLSSKQAVGSVHSEVFTIDDAPAAAALVNVDVAGTANGSRLVATVQLSLLRADGDDRPAGTVEQAAEIQQGLDVALDRLVGIAERTMVLERVIRAPRARVWNAWMNPETLPQWWGPDGFTCRTQRIDLRDGGEWVFDMIAPDGTVFPNHHRYHDVQPQERFGYTLLWGENGPPHADAWASFEDLDGATRVTLGMVFSTAAQFHDARGFGAPELGQQTLGKLERIVLDR